ncbi:hypothetical protein M9H77_22068 [Catharanthus roseus]|uniref:Uncharacterized protein n=1 Tax=Catharanthus roseus TaxID=4058 RepID=A0ACC0AQW9_CATRO|nr:hypothetical protein M9H77_22068 [Catharanthus roseus]
MKRKGVATWEKLARYVEASPATWRPFCGRLGVDFCVQVASVGKRRFPSDIVPDSTDSKASASCLCVDFYCAVYLLSLCCNSVLHSQALRTLWDTPVVVKFSALTGLCICNGPIFALGKSYPLRAVNPLYVLVAFTLLLCCSFFLLNLAGSSSFFLACRHYVVLLFLWFWSAACVAWPLGHFVRAQVENNVPETSVSTSRTLGPDDTLSSAKGKASSDQPKQDLPKKSFVYLFKDNRNPNKEITLYKIENQDDMVEIEEEEVDDVIKTWGHALVGYVVGGFPGMAASSKLTSSLKVPTKFQVHKSGWIIFKFNNEEDRQHDPYKIFGRPFILKNMPPLFEFDTCKNTLMPVWVTLLGLPMDLWTEKALAKICSKIGEPLCTDTMTEKRERVSYAWALIEVNVTKELVTEIYIHLPNGNIREQFVIYENVPKFCSFCKMLRYSIDGCKKKKQEVTGGKQKEGAQNQFADGGGKWRSNKNGEGQASSSFLKQGMAMKEPHKKDIASVTQNHPPDGQDPGAAKGKKGDFNSVLYSGDREGHVQVSSYEVRDFMTCCVDLGLGNVQVWFSEGLYANARFLPSGFISDHLSCIVSLFEEPKIHKPNFMFFNMQCEHDLFLGLVEAGWSISVIGTKQYILCYKLKKLKRSLKDLNKKHYGYISSKTEAVKSELKQKQEELHDNPHDEQLK